MPMQKFTPQALQFVNSINSAFDARERELAETYKDIMLINAGYAAPLPRDFGMQWATEGIEIQRDELVIFNALNRISRPIDIATFIDHFMTISDSGEVNASIDGQSQARGDQAAFNYHGVPVGIYDSVATFGWKQMAAAANRNFNLQAPSLNNKQRKVSEYMEKLMLEGNDISFGDVKTYGLRNAPQRNSGTFTGALQDMDGAEFKDVGILLMERQHAAKYRSSVMVFMNHNDHYNAQVTDYSKQFPQKVKLTGLMEALPAGSVVIPSANVPVDEMLAICPRRDVYEILNALAMTNVIKRRDEMTDPYQVKVMMSAALQLKFDDNGNAGYTQLTKA